MSKASILITDTGFVEAIFLSAVEDEDVENEETLSVVPPASLTDGVLGFNGKSSSPGAPSEELGLRK